MHLLFHLGKDVDSIPSNVSKEALSAGIDFVKVACQQTAYMVGRGKIEDEIQKFQNGLLWCTHVLP